MSRFTHAFVLLLITGIAVGQQPACQRNNFGLFEDINCAVAALQAADRELNATYARLLTLLAPREASALRKAQRAWLEFVKADARFTEDREGDGSAGRLIVTNNRERQTRERTLELKSWIAR